MAFHAFLDGRDVPPESAAGQIGQIEDSLKAIDGAFLATLCGHYYTWIATNVGIGSKEPIIFWFWARGRVRAFRH